jgi:AraC-like DNA-binding protein
MRARVRSYVDNHIRDPQLSVESIAAAMRCSTRHLQNIFAHLEPLARYIWRIRLERCAAALRETCYLDRSVTEIAFSYGFSNASHFSRAFKARFGMSPREFRLKSAH